MAVLFVANRDGSNLHEVISAPRLVVLTVEGMAAQYWPEFQPDWSADGRLVYALPKKSDGFTIEVSAADGTARTTIFTSTNPVRTSSDLRYINNPRWGLGDSMITAVIGGQIYGMNPDGTNARPLASLTTGGGGYIWSPDRKSIAFSSTTSSQGTISILDPASGSVRQITVPPLRAFCWAPNSGAFSIVSLGNPQHEWSSIYTVQADGSGLRTAVTAIMDLFNPVIGAWSPDGQFLVYTDDRRWSGGPVGPQLYAQSIDAGTNTKLSDVTKIVWFTIAEVGGCGRAFVYPSP
jgi:Tol biopolymer transport system component